MQLTAGSKLVVRPCDVKQAANFKGIYILCVKPTAHGEEAGPFDAADLDGWRAFHCEKASTQDIGNRIASYIVGSTFWGATRPCEQLTDKELSCKCKMAKALLTRAGVWQ